MVKSCGSRRWLVICVNIVGRCHRREEWHRGPTESGLQRNERLEGEDVRHQGNPLAEPNPFPQGWTSTVHLHRVESSHKVRARNREKKDRESRDVVRRQKRTLWMDPPAGFHWQREGRWRRAFYYSPRRDTIIGGNVGGGSNPIDWASASGVY